MATQHVDFTTPQDTGEQDPSSIAPLEDGERGNAATFNRPTEALRARTETVRRTLEDLKYLTDADRALLLTATGTLTWKGVYDAGVADSGTVVLAAGARLELRPFLTPAASLRAQAVIDGVRFTIYETLPAPYEDLPVPRSYSGANLFTVEVIAGADQPDVMSIGGTPEDDFTFYINSNTTTRQMLVDRINDYEECKSRGLKAELVDELTGPTLITAGTTKVTLQGALEAEMHQVTDAGLAAFFAADVDNRLLEGDVLCIWYDDLVLESGGGRRQSIPELGVDATNCDSNLFVLRHYPERAPLALPLMRVQGGNLHLINGASLTPNVARVPDQSAFPLLRHSNLFITEAVDDGAAAYLEVTPGADVPDLPAIKGTGQQDTAGVMGQGGTDGGAGVIGTGGDGGAGVIGTGGDGGPGVKGVGVPGVYGLTPIINGSFEGAAIHGRARIDGYPNPFVNATGVRGEGGGVGVGVVGVGGVLAGVGVHGTGGGGVSTTEPIGGTGVEGIGGAGTDFKGYGVLGKGAIGVWGEATDGASDSVDLSGIGVYGKGYAAANGRGVFGQGAGAGAGVEGTGGPTNGIGVKGIGTGTGAGVSGTGGAAHGIGVSGLGKGAGTGVIGEGGANGGVGVLGSGKGTGAGIRGTSEAGYGGTFEGNANWAALRLVPQATTPTPHRGAFFVNDVGKLYFCADNLTWQEVTLGATLS